MQPSFWIYKFPRHSCYDQAKTHDIAPTRSYIHLMFCCFANPTASQFGENESANLELKQTPSAGSDYEASATVMSSSLGILAS